MKKATGLISILTCIFILAISFPFSIFTDTPSSVTLEEDEEIFEETKALETELLSYSNQGFVTYTENDFTFRWAVSNKTLSDGSSCTGMQGFNAGTTYAYAAKTGSNDTRCAIVRTNMNDGSQTVMNYYSSLSATSPSPCDTAGHANDMVVRGITENGVNVNYLYISTMKTPHVITRMKISGSNLYFTGCFNTVNTSGKTVSFAAIKWAKTSGGYHYFLLKAGNSFYYTKISTTASGGPISNPTKVNCYRLFNIDSKNAVFATSNSSYKTIAGIEDWTNQGFCYDDANNILYVPVWDSATNRNAIITYNLKDVVTDATLNSAKDNTPLVFPTKLSFLTHSNEFFEMESCDFRTGQGTTGDLKLYFNVNASAAKEGIYSFNYSRNTGPFTPYVTSDSIIYNVKYNANGGSGSMGTTKHIKGLSAALRNNKFTLSRAEFIGWNLHRASDNKWLYRKTDGNVSWYLEGKQPEGAQKALYENQRFVSQLTGVNGDTITAYAQWKPSTDAYTETWQEKACFDPMVYRGRYQDLNEMTDAQLKDHWIIHGITEGRCGSVIFEAQYYVNNNADLKAAFGTNWRNAYYHFLTSGYKEHRKSSPTFDGEYYTSRHPDVAASYKENYIEHYLYYGINEGRRASATFDVNYYIFTRDDVAQTWPGDLKTATQHYAGYGIKEGYDGYDKIAPLISDVTVTDISSKGYTVTCKVTDNWEIDNVAFPTWTSDNGQDDLNPNWGMENLGTKNGNTYTFRVNTSDHNNEIGDYSTHIYATDKGGNMGDYSIDNIMVDDPKKEITLLSSSEYSKNGKTVQGIKTKTTISVLLSNFDNTDLKVISSAGEALENNALAGTGTKVQLLNNTDVVDTVTIIVAGDTNGSGTVDSTDYIQVKSAFLKTFTLDENQFLAADVDGSGTVDSTDYMRIKSHFLGTFSLD